MSNPALTTSPKGFCVPMAFTKSPTLFTVAYRSAVHPTSHRAGTIAAGEGVTLTYELQLPVDPLQLPHYTVAFLEDGTGLVLERPAVDEHLAAAGTTGVPTDRGWHYATLSLRLLVLDLSDLLLSSCIVLKLAPPSRPVGLRVVGHVASSPNHVVFDQRDASGQR